MVKTLDLVQMRQDNRATILGLIWKRSDISRAELARITGMSRSSISEIVSELIEIKLIREEGAGLSKGGRRPVYLKFSNDVCQVLSIQVGRNISCVGLLNLRGELQNFHQLEVGINSSPQLYLSTLFKEIGLFLKKNLRSKILGIGVALPLPLRLDRSISFPESVYPSWQDINLIEEIEEHFNYPVFYENDANLGALAQQWFKPQYHKNLAYIEMADGFGAGFIIDGKVFRGSSGLAGEIGHMIVDSKSDQWHRGIQGAVNALIGGEALKHRILGLKERFPDSSLNIDSTPTHIVQEALKGDVLAKELCLHLSRYLGIVVVNILCLLNLESIVIGGPIAPLGSLIIDTIYETIKEKTLWDDYQSVNIETASFGDKQIIMGAGVQVIAALIKGDINMPLGQE